MKKLSKRQSQKINNEVPYDQDTIPGFMTYYPLENGLRSLDFAPTDYARLKPFVTDCKVQVTRDGSVYINEKPKRIHNKPLFREDNSTLTLGRDGKFYFVFTMEEELVDELPEQLVLQAVAIAKKVIDYLIKGKEVKR